MLAQEQRILLPTTPSSHLLWASKEVRFCPKPRTRQRCSDPDWGANGSCRDRQASCLPHPQSISLQYHCGKTVGFWAGFQSSRGSGVFPSNCPRSPVRDLAPKPLSEASSWSKVPGRCLQGPNVLCGSKIKGQVQGWGNRSERLRAGPYIPRTQHRWPH